MQPPQFPVRCAQCRRRIADTELRTTAGLAHHTSGWRVIVCGRPCFEALRRTAPLPRYNSRRERDPRGGPSFERIRALAGIVGDGVRIAPSTLPIQGAGNGVFATRDYPKGAPITEYVGLVRPLAVGYALSLGERSHMIDFGNGRLTLDGRYTPEGTLITDPVAQLTGRGGGAYLNDPRGTGLVDNVEFEELESADAALLTEEAREHEITPQMYMMMMRASRDVYAGDELLVDYGDDYWDHRRN